MQIDLSEDRSAELAQRLAQIDGERFVSYTLAVHYLERFEELVLNERPRHYFLTGVSGNGKTTLARFFQSRHPAVLNPRGDAAVLPTLRVICPEKSSVGQFGEELLNRVMQESPRGTTAIEKLRVAKTIIRNLNVKVVFVDEIQHLHVGSVQERAGMRNAIKRLCDECGVSVVAIGIPSALGILAQEPQLKRRFKPITLPRWKADDEGRSLLHRLEQDLGLEKESRIAQNAQLSRFIIDRAEGVLEFIADQMREAGKAAICSGKEKIDQTLIEEIDWTCNLRAYEAAATSVGMARLELGRC